MRAQLLTLSFLALGAVVLVSGCSSDDDSSADGGGGSAGSDGSGGTSSGGGAPDCTRDACGVCDGDGTSCECHDAWCEAIVDEHNKIRVSVSAGTYYDQPKAEPALEPMVWDPLIAAKAQAYADTVTDFSQGHSSSEYRTYASTNYDGYHGENISIGSGSYADPAYFVAESWGANEAQGCELASCGGHYTQVVWRETVAVGCGKKDGVTFGSNTGTLTVCQYGPGGNINGRDPY